jgi:hypothetical protein
MAQILTFSFHQSRPVKNVLSFGHPCSMENSFKVLTLTATMGIRCTFANGE